MRPIPKRVINRYQQDILRKRHVVGVGYGLKEKNGKNIGEDAIVVLVDRKISTKKLRNRDIVPQKISSYQTDVIEIGDIEFLNLRTEKMRPAQPGVSIGHYKVSAGTLGAIVRDKKSGKPLILSNNHVLANITDGQDGRAQIGDDILQPGSYDDGDPSEDVIGHLSRFVPIKRGDETGEPTCPVAMTMERLTNAFVHMFRSDYHFKLFKQASENLVDCAVAKPVSGNDVDSEIINIGKVNGVIEPEVGMKVQKSGRTSGVTEGKIKVVDSTIEVRMSETEVAYFKDQIVIEPLSKPGDSGSLVLNKDNKAVGLLFAGSNQATVCNKIDNVLNALSIEF